MGSSAMIEIKALVSVRVAMLAAIALSFSGSDATAQEKPKEAQRYSYATKGLMEFQSPVEPGKVEHWKLLLDQSNLGGKELEMVELTLPAGEVVGAHHHGSVEIFYVLSGILDHEVNGEMHVLTPGMVGVVRPEDSVRHIVPKNADVKLLVIWAPAGEAKKFFSHAKATPIEQR
jgi:quercetin dioxygenase-like cupin family protein